MKKKKSVGIIASALSFIMFAHCVPMTVLQVFADELKELSTKEETLEIEEPKPVIGEMVDIYNFENAYIIQENVSKRTLTTKEFLMSNEKIMVQQFSEPVHYYENGEYKEIENSLQKADLQKEESRQTSEEGFFYASVDNNGNVATNNDILVGSKDGVESKGYLQFKIPEQEPYYKLLGAQVAFNYVAQGLEEDEISSYKVRVVEEMKFEKPALSGSVESTDEIDIAIESESKLENNAETSDESSTETGGESDLENSSETLQKLNSITATGQAEYTLYESEMIRASDLQGETLTIEIESENEIAGSANISIMTSAGVSPTMSYWYDAVTGLDDEYSYETFEIEGATTYVNNWTGGLTISCDLASINTMSEMPFEASLIYNSDYDSVWTGISKDSVFGKHFKLNFQQYMIKEGDVYKWIDADGSITTFYQTASNSTSYYAKTQSLYFTETGSEFSGKPTIYDRQGNQMVFENWRLTKIISGATGDYIEIKYSRDIGFYVPDYITEIRYYEGGTSPTYKMTVSYDSNERAQTVCTYDNSTLLTTYALTYDSYGYLLDITNTNANIRVFGFEYDQQLDNLLFMCNYQKDGYVFHNAEGIVKVLEVKGTHNNALRVWHKSTEFDYMFANTTISYFEDEIPTGEKTIAFNNMGKAISQWTEIEDGVLSIVNTNNWRTPEQTESGDYYENTFSYIWNSSSETQLLGKGQSISYTISKASLGIDAPSMVYAYALNIGLTGIKVNVDVQIGEEPAEKIALSGGGTVYASKKCDFYDNTTVTITNNATASVILLGVSYGLVNYAYERSEYSGNSEETKKLEESIVKTKGGEYTLTRYDAKERANLVQRKNIDDSSTLETTLYTYYDTTDIKEAKGAVRSVSTLAPDNSIISKTDYTYTKATTGNSVTLETKTTYGDIKQRTVETIDKTSNPIIVTQQDENGAETKAYYSRYTSGDTRLTKVEYDNVREQYTYNAFGQVTGINVYDKTTNALLSSQTDTYTNGVYTSSAYGGNSYGYGYDTYGLIRSMKKNNSNMITYSYYNYSSNTAPNKLSSKTYANGHLESYSYSTDELEVTHKNSSSSSRNNKYAYKLDGQGNVTTQEVYTTSDTSPVLTYEYTNDINNIRTISGLEISDLQFGATYQTNSDAGGKINNSTLTSFSACYNTESTYAEYTYNEYGQIEKITYDNDYSIAYYYDSMHRVSGYQVFKFQDSLRQNVYAYKTYVVNGQTYYTNQISQITGEAGRNSTAVTDTNGYITGVTYNNKENTYTYDSLGRLASETYDGATTTYAYDSANNITQKTRNGATTNYVYDSQGRLTQYGSKTFSYDAMGNPTTYKGSTLTWAQGRKLVSGTQNGNNFTYAYDGNGMRYKKKVGNLTTEYYYNGDQLLMENRPSVGRVYYLYDATGITGMIYQGEHYFFDKNTLGDIVSICDRHGDTVATYCYDAWGNVIAKTGILADANPFRYRGYYYDAETGFYYLQTRYYDPTIGRFINADNYELIGTLSQTVGQLNMYAYCGNNPIMYTDPTGCLFENIGRWLDSLGDGIEWIVDGLKIVVDNIIECFYFNAGVGVGIGGGIKLGPLEVGVVAMISYGLEALPTPYIGTFQKILFEIGIGNIGWAYGMDDFSKAGDELSGDFKKQSQDITIGFGVSFYFGAGAFFEVGFNVSKFFDLMGW